MANRRLDIEQLRKRYEAAQRCGDSAMVRLMERQIQDPQLLALLTEKDAELEVAFPTSITGKK